MITLIKWNGEKEKKLAILAKQAGKKKGEPDETFVKRKLTEWSSKRLKVSTNNA